MLKMKEVLAHIEKKKQEFAKLPLFEYMRDTSIDPRQRLAWVPCAAPLVMNFADLNKHFFRREALNNPIQELVNEHTYEDDNHWEWFLEDIATLGFNNSQNFNDFLRFIWSEETEKTRLVCQKIAVQIFKADSIILMIAIKTLEATWTVTQTLTLSVTQELKQITKQKFYFFGESHFEVENNHSMKSEEAEKIIENIKLTENQKKQAFYLIDNIFEAFHNCVDEMMCYGKKHPVLVLIKAV
jgi:hypothetical protein